MNVFFVSGTQNLLNMLQEITGRDKSTPTANSHTPSKLSSYCSPNTQEASMLCYCWMTRWQVGERIQVEKESGIWEARESNQIGSGICFCYLQPDPDPDQLFAIEPEPWGHWDSSPNRKVQRMMGKTAAGVMVGRVPEIGWCQMFCIGCCGGFNFSFQCLIWDTLNKP